MRKWHRWIATVAGLFVAFVSITGALMHIDMFISGVPPPGSEPPPPPGIAANKLDAAALGDMVERAASTTRANQPGLDVARIEVALKDGKTVITLGGADPKSPSLRYDGESGGPAAALPPKKKNYHYVLQDLHAGYFGGVAGRILSTLLGLSLLVLTLKKPSAAVLGGDAH